MADPCHFIHESPLVNILLRYFALPQGVRCEFGFCWRVRKKESNASSRMDEGRGGEEMHGWIVFSLCNFLTLPTYSLSCVFSSSFLLPMPPPPLTPSLHWRCLPVEHVGVGGGVFAQGASRPCYTRPSHCDGDTRVLGEGVVQLQEPTATASCARRSRAR